MAVSIGTSGTAFAVSAVAGRRPHRRGGRLRRRHRAVPAAGLHDQRGPGADAAAALLGTDLDGLSALALAAAPGAGGLTLLPYLDGERTPDRPDATGVLRGLTTRNATPENLARAAVEAVLPRWPTPPTALRGATGVSPARVLLIGGAAKSRAVRAARRPASSARRSSVPEPDEYVALGAARQAAWALAGARRAAVAGRGGPPRAYYRRPRARDPRSATPRSATTPPPGKEGTRP